MVCTGTGGSSASKSNRASQGRPGAPPSGVRSHGSVRRERTTCGSTFAYSPWLLAGGKTAATSPGSRRKRSPCTAKRRVLTYASSISSPPPRGRVLARRCSTEITYSPASSGGRKCSMKVSFPDVGGALGSAMRLRSREWRAGGSGGGLLAQEAQHWRMQQHLVRGRGQARHVHLRRDRDASGGERPEDRGAPPGHGSVHQGGLEGGEGLGLVERVGAGHHGPRPC